ncbi:MAG: OmpH family outer membrane protein [Acidobacteriota bacterium]
MRPFVVAVALACLLAGAPSFAQTPAPAAPPPAAAAPPEAQPAPRPYPEGAKVAYVVLQRIANESEDGKAAAAKIQAFQQQKAAELNEKNKQLQALQQKLEKEGSVMSVSAQAELQKQIERTQVEIQRFTQDAQADLQELQNNLQAEFTQKIEPVLAEVGREKNLHFIFNGPDAGLVWADAALDVSADVIKKLNAPKK